MASETASDLAFPPENLDRGAGRAERARSVSAELEAIFGQPRVEAQRPDAAAPVARSPARGGSARRRLSAASLGAVGAAALAGLAAGTLLVRPKPSHPPPRPAALPVELAPPAQVAPPRIAPPAPDAALAEAPPVPIAPVIRAAPHVARAPVTHQAARPSRPARMKPREHAGGYADLRAADRRLRIAYDDAIRAGAPPAVLAEQRDRWARLRLHERSEARLAADYRAIAHDLDRAAARARRARRPLHRSFFHPRFAPWWR